MYAIRYFNTGGGRRPYLWWCLINTGPLYEILCVLISRFDKLMISSFWFEKMFPSLTNNCFGCTF